MHGFWKLFSRNRSAVLGLGIIIAIILMAITAPLFFPGDPFGLAGKSMSPPGENGFLLGSDSLSCCQSVEREGMPCRNPLSVAWRSAKKKYSAVPI